MKYLNFFFNYNLNEEFYNYIYFSKSFINIKIIFQNNKNQIFIINFNCLKN